MTINLTKARFTGPALPEPFVKFELEKEISNLLPKNTGEQGKELKKKWDYYREKLKRCSSNAGGISIMSSIIEPIMDLLGYKEKEDCEEVETRERKEPAGYLLKSEQGKVLRVWTFEKETNLEAPRRRGEAYRFSPIKTAVRVLGVVQERVAVLTNGNELKILLYDPAKPESDINISIDADWLPSRFEVPDTFRLFIALCSPAGVELLPKIIDKARLNQAKITKDLRRQARQAVEEFIQGILQEKENLTVVNKYEDKQSLARLLWHEGLVIVYRLLFILKGESNDDPARAFKFTSSDIWRKTYSPSLKLSKIARMILDEQVDTKNMLSEGLKSLFRMFETGVDSSRLNIPALGGTLFGEKSAPIISKLKWPEIACAKLMDKLLWTIQKRGNSDSRLRIHYGSLDIEDLGRVYEALLELDAGIAEEKMCRLRRAKLEVIVPYKQGEKYKTEEQKKDNDDDDSDEEDSEENSGKKIEWIEEIQRDKFYMRVGLGRKATGSYYTPHSFVRFLVRETVGTKIDEISSRDNPSPNKILEIKVIDPAMGSGHFLVEACRFMGDKLYEACRLCDEKAAGLKEKSDGEKDLIKKLEYARQSEEWLQKVIDLPDPNDELLQYLPSRLAKDETQGVAISKAKALCKRLVSVHCLYGVDKNPLAVELAKLSLWLESMSEGYPLTFLDHRFMVGDSITGPLFDDLLKLPVSQQPIDEMFNKGLKEKLTEKLHGAIKEVVELEKSVGISMDEIEGKKKTKQRLDEIMLPFKVLAAAWAGSVMMGEEGDDNDYADLMRYVATTGNLPLVISSEIIVKAIQKGSGIEENIDYQSIIKKWKEGQVIPSFAYDLSFPEVFTKNSGFDVTFGNPPWDRIEVNEEDFWCNFDITILDYPDKNSRQPLISGLIAKNINARKMWVALNDNIQKLLRYLDKIYQYQSVKINDKYTTGSPDLYRAFAEKMFNLIKIEGFIGVLLPGAFHSNEGATGIRELFLNKASLKFCYSYENRKKLFEIDGRFKFDLIKVKKTVNNNTDFDCAFYLHDESMIFRDDWRGIQYTKEQLILLSGKNLSFPECRSKFDLDLLMSLKQIKQSSMKTFSAENSIIFYPGIELHRNPEFNLKQKKTIAGNAWSSEDVLKSGKLLPVYEGKCFNQYLDYGNYEIDTMSPKEKVLLKEKWNPSIYFYRLAFRAVAASTNERTLIATMLRPGCICDHTCFIEAFPEKRPNCKALTLLSYLNSFIADWNIRQRVTTNISSGHFNALLVPDTIFQSFSTFLAHCSLYFLSNHFGYDGLFKEQINQNNEKEKFPVIKQQEQRDELRAVVDTKSAQDDRSIRSKATALSGHDDHRVKQHIILDSNHTFSTNFIQYLFVFFSWNLLSFQIYRTYLEACLLPRQQLLARL